LLLKSIFVPLDVIVSKALNVLLSVKRGG